MNTAQRIAELERERSEQWSTLELTTARIHGIDAELARLRAGTAIAGDLTDAKLTDAKLTDAICTVLQASVSAMSPTAIMARLKDGGRVETPTKVNATLAYLKQRNRVRNEGRAAWRAM